VLFVNTNVKGILLWQNALAYYVHTTLAL
jgi:hypothetical protein